MANFGKTTLIAKGFIQRFATFSGTVFNEATPEIRPVLFYKKGFPEVVVAETVSDAAGDFSVEVPCGSNDSLYAICIGETGENSAIFRGISG